MRKRLPVLLAAGMVTTSFSLVTSANAAAPVDTITSTLTKINVIGINDFHGAIANGGAFACTLEKSKAALGETSTAFIAAGDNIGATPFVSSYDRDNPTIDYLNTLGLQASSVGNHEFDRGFSDLTGRVSTAANYEYLGANVYTKGTSTPALPEYKILTVNGIKVGVIGAVTSEAPTLVSPSGVATLDFGDPVDAVNRVTAQLKDGNDANGEADVIVATYHEGAANSTTLTEELKSPVFAKIVNQTSPLVSAIFNGHTHRAYNFQAPIPGGTGTRPVIQSGNAGANLAQVSLGYDPTTRTVTEYKAELVKTEKPAAGDTCLTDPEYVAATAIVDRAVTESEQIGNEVVGNISDDITTADQSPTVENGVYTGVWDKPNRDDRAHASALGNLSAEAWRAAMVERGRPDTVIGVQNPGGLRSDLLYARSGAETADGQVTLSEVSAVHPFANTLQTIDITGAKFKEMLEQQWQPGKTRPYLALGLSDNVSYTYDPTRPLGERVTNLWINSAPMSPTARYTVVSGAFLIEGGDNFTALTSGVNKADSGVIDTDAFRNYFKDSPNVTRAAPTKVVSPDYTVRSLGVVGAPALSSLYPGAAVSPDHPFTFELQGFDLTSRSAPANTEVWVSIDGESYGSFPVETRRVVTSDLPADGVASVSINFTPEQVKQLVDGKSHTLTVRSATQDRGIALDLNFTMARPGLPTTGVSDGLAPAALLLVGLIGLAGVIRRFA